MILLLAALVSPPCPPPFRVDAVVARIEAESGTMLDLVSIPGAHVDQILVASVAGTVMLFPFKDGCAIAGPHAIDTVAPVVPAHGFEPR